MQRALASAVAAFHIITGVPFTSLRVCPQIRGIKTNIPFMENVLRHPVFLNGAATTGFIETYSKDLFKFEGHSNIRANKLLMYLADMVRTHPGWGGG